MFGSRYSYRDAARTLARSPRLARPSPLGMGRVTRLLLSLSRSDSGSRPSVARDAHGLTLVVAPPPRARSPQHSVTPAQHSGSHPRIPAFRDPEIDSITHLAVTSGVDYRVELELGLLCGPRTPRDRTPHHAPHHSAFSTRAPRPSRALGWLVSIGTPRRSRLDSSVARIRSCDRL